MTAIVLLKEPKSRSLFRTIRRYFTKPACEVRSLPDHSFSYLFCEAELPQKPGRREYAKLQKNLMTLLEEHHCKTVCLYGPSAQALKRDLAFYGFESPAPEPLKRMLFDKLLDFTMEKLMKEPCERAALVDYEGNYYSEGLLYALCDRFRYVTLVTANAPYFEPAERHIMDGYGLALQVTESGEEISGCGLYVLASGGDRVLYHYSRNRENIVICMSEDIRTSFIGLRSIVCRPVVKLNAELAEYFPEEITDTQAAELMAADGVERVGEMVEIIGTD